MSVEKDREKTLRARDDVESGTGQKEGEEDDDERHQKQQQQVDTNSSSTLFLNHNQIRFHHLAAATGLIVTYFIEIIVQIFLIVVCCRTTNLSEVTSAWSWFLVCSFAVSSLVVTVVSIVWVCRSLDFAGRLCGRLLCYVMHSLLLGLLWRYLKLAFVYDRADIQEFVALRILQTYFQSLPLTSIHLAWLISSRQNWSSVTLGIVLLEFVSIVTALILSSYIKSSSSSTFPWSSCSSSTSSSSTQDQHIKSKSEQQVMQMIVKNFHCSSNRQSNSLWSQLLETHLLVLSRSLLLSCRLLVIGLIIVHLKYWTCMFTLVHFILSFTWISFSVNNHPHHHSSSSSHSSRHILLEEMEEVSLTKGKDFVTLVTEWSYILFWDVTSTLSNNISWSTWILPVLLAMLENGVMVLYHWYQKEDPLVTIVSGSCLLLGWLLFSSLNFVRTYSGSSSGGGGKCCSHHHHQDEDRQSDKGTTNVGSITKDKSQQTSAIDPITKNPHNHHHHQHPLPLPSNQTVIFKSETDDKKPIKISQADSLPWNSKKIHPAVWDLSLFSTSTNPPTLPNNYHNINDVLRNKVKVNVFNTEKFQQSTNKNGRKSKIDSSPDKEVYTNTSRVSPPEGMKNGMNNTNPSQSPLLPTTWVPDTFPDTCCNDSNGSSNSRNTNTLREMGNPLPDLDNLDNENDDDTDVDNSNFVFYFPTDSSVQQSVTSARLQKCSDRNERISNLNLSGSGEVVINLDSKTNISNTIGVGILQSGGSSYRKPKPKKKSRSSSVSSFSNVRRYRTSTPIEIKKASRILVNNPYPNAKELTMTTVTSGVNKSRCHCHVDKCCVGQQGRGGGDFNKDHDHNHHDENKKVKQHQNPHSHSHHQQSQSQYENLIEDSYGILICESSSMGGPMEESSYPQPHHHHEPKEGGGGGRGGDEHHHHHHSRLPFQLHNSNSNCTSMGRYESSSRKMIKVLCAKCLQNHDPLLTNCLETDNLHTHSHLTKDDRTSQVLLALGSSHHDPSSQQKQQQQQQQHHRQPQPHHNHRHYHHGQPISGKNRNFSNPATTNSRRPTRQPLPIPIPMPMPMSMPMPTRRSSNSLVDDDDEEEDDDHDDPLPSDTTDYPSETEMTCTVEGDDEQLSVSSNLSTATYTTWPHSTAPNFSMWSTSTMMPQSRFPKEFTSLEYVRTWLLTSQARLWQHRQNRACSRSRLAKKVYRSNTMSAQSRRVRFVGVMTKDQDTSITPTTPTAYVESVNPSRKSLSRRQGPVGRVPSSCLQLHDEHSQQTSLPCSPPPPLPLPLGLPLPTSLSLTSSQPPRQKQHPVLPHNSVPHPNHNHKPNHHKKGSRPLTTNCHTSTSNSNCTNNSNNNSKHVSNQNEQSDKFFKDVEIIL